MGERLVLTESDAYGLLAFLVTSARGLLHEPADYGYQRLLLAAQRLAGPLRMRSEAEAQPFLKELLESIDGLVPFPESEAQLAATLDRCCALVARELVRQTYRRE